MLTHGWRAAGHELAAVLGVPQEAVEALRRTGAGARARQAHDFPALFALWHGRPPADEDWPAPRKAGQGGRVASAPRSRCSPAWSASSVAGEIAGALTARLRERNWGSSGGTDGGRRAGAHTDRTAVRRRAGQHHRCRRGPARQDRPRWFTRPSRRARWLRARWAGCW